MGVAKLRGGVNAESRDDTGPCWILRSSGVRAPERIGWPAPGTPGHGPQRGGGPGGLVCAAFVRVPDLACNATTPRRPRSRVST